MKFIKGFVVTIALYAGLSLLFAILVQYLNTVPPIIDPFASLDNLGKTFHSSLSQPVIASTFASTVAFILLPTNIGILLQALGSIIPVLVAALVGSIVEKKSGSVKFIFLSTFIALLVVAALGIILDMVGSGMLANMDATAKFLTSGLIMSALNAFIWCAIGVFVTSKGWG
ncbi:MAG: hypothetical protein GYA24_20995 [Candidatus Lokiarchaeota archaeon]|nr:hypothetical protein [Candidatus Lokiarchaeota archaeon]